MSAQCDLTGKSDNDECPKHKTHFDLREIWICYCFLTSVHVFMLPSIPRCILPIFPLSAPVLSCRLPPWKALTLPSCTLASTARMMSWWFRRLPHQGLALDLCPCLQKMDSVGQTTESSQLPYLKTPLRHPAAAKGMKGEMNQISWHMLTYKRSFSVSTIL